MLCSNFVVTALAALNFLYGVEAGVVFVKPSLLSSSVMPSKARKIVTATLTSTVVVCPTDSAFNSSSSSASSFSASITLLDHIQTSAAQLLQSFVSSSGSFPVSTSKTTLATVRSSSSEAISKTNSTNLHVISTSDIPTSTFSTLPIAIISPTISSDANFTLSSTKVIATSPSIITSPSSIKFSPTNSSAIFSSRTKKPCPTGAASSSIKLPATNSTILSSSSTNTASKISPTATKPSVTNSSTLSSSSTKTASPTGTASSSFNFPTTNPKTLPLSSTRTKSTFSPIATSPSSGDYCENSPTSRRCWGNYSIDTDWYSTVPDTGVTREYWLSVENTTLSPDGYERQTLTFNGTIPGPAIIADWGDNLVIHVTNNLSYNGTSIHWHRLRQLGSSKYDGVPGVTQCPIAPGDTMTYRFRATQYGSTWYHSHFSLQYADGLFGPLILNGPATADYDEDLGLLFLSDRSHTSAFTLWESAKAGLPPALENGSINGTNTFNCSRFTDPHCIGGGKKLETVFEKGKRYRIRFINVAIDGHFELSIDGHKLIVITNDLVPIVPFETDSIVIGEGQRYDLIVEANAEPGDYWLRAGWQTACSKNQNVGDITSIIRYNASSTSGPTTTGITPGSNCADEPPENLVSYLSMNVGKFSEVTEESLGYVFEDAFLWTINSSSLYMNWSDPTTLRGLKGLDVFPEVYNVVAEEVSTDEWAVYVIQDKSNIRLSHPIHLHGHDFFLIGQDVGTFSLTTSKLNLINPPRRDVASLPANGYLAMAFKKDNPGAWIMHCHIAWHASQGLGMEFVESRGEITMRGEDKIEFEDTCTRWDAYKVGEVYLQDDSGV